MRKKKFRYEHQHHTAASLRLVEPLFGSGRLIVGDSWFGSVNTAVAMMDKGLHFLGNIKTCHALFPQAVLREHTPMEHGQALIYETVFKGHKLNAVSVRKGKKKYRLMISTRGTSIVTGEQSWGGFDKKGFRYKVTKPQIDIDANYTKAQPHVDVHNKLRQRSLALEKSWLTKRYESRAMATGLAIVATDAYLMYLTMSAGKRKYGHEKHNFRLFVKNLSMQLCVNERWTSTCNGLVGNQRYRSKFGINLSTSNQTTVNACNAALSHTSTEGRNHNELSTFHAHNPQLYKAGYQKHCVVCKMTRTSYFCKTCGTDVPVHNPEGRSQYKKCKSIHIKDPMARAKKRGQRPDLRTPCKKARTATTVTPPVAPVAVNDVAV